MHGGAGGIGTFAIQLAHRARRAGVHDRRDAGEARRCAAALGADVTRSTTASEDFVEVVRAETDGGADVILDNMGAKYLGRNVDALATEGRLVDHRHAGRHQGRARHQRAAAQARRGHRDLAARRGPAEEKAAICASVVEHVWPLVADGRGPADRGHGTLPLAEAGAAHALMESGEHTGKILLDRLRAGFGCARIR